MKCPACGKRLLSIRYGMGEYICDNPECPAKRDNTATNPEWYGNTQEQINKMWKGK